MRKTVIVGGNLRDAAQRITDAWHQAEQGEPVEPQDTVTFATWSALASVMTDKRHEPLRRLHGQPRADYDEIRTSIKLEPHAA